ncbi:MAG: aminodeoxychorismate synthase component I [Verrucomicrobia bacterium]|nr:aminodeoxychorismate synthase component I [Verrucomicrobiota bacterium]
MRVQITEVAAPGSPESLVERLGGEAGVVLLRSGQFDPFQGRYSFVTARPFLTLRADGSRCELHDGHTSRWHFGDPWRVLDSLMGRFELLDEADLPFPLGGCFGCWGYDLKNFLEPRLTRRAANDLELPDCYAGFHDSLVAFDHALGKAWIVSTGMTPDGSRSARQAREATEFWQTKLAASDRQGPSVDEAIASARETSLRRGGSAEPRRSSNLSRAAFIAAVERAQRYIRAGDIYQVNLSQRLTAPLPASGWELFQRLSAVSPAPFAAYLDGGGFQLASSSPELFLKLSGGQILTRPIKGTRPRAAEPDRDAQLSYELQTSPKELAELVMITDLLRNDLGRVCEFGSVRVPELARLERFSHVQHLVSTVEGRLRPEVTHLAALAACFPGGSITGAPKIRAMEIIDELEPTTRGPYTGCLGYLGFNRESQFSITIRTAICLGGAAHFHVGAGIVADSNPEAEYEETLAKAGGFEAALGWQEERGVLNAAEGEDVKRKTENVK